MYNNLCTLILNDKFHAFLPEANHVLKFFFFSPTISLRGKSHALNKKQQKKYSIHVSKEQKNHNQTNFLFT